MGTRRTRRGCLSWQPSYSRRSRLIKKQIEEARRLPLSILPSSGRPSRSWKRLRRDLSWLSLSLDSNLDSNSRTRTTDIIQELCNPYSAPYPPLLSHHPAPYSQLNQFNQI